MKETRFIAQNKEKWLESENLLKDRIKDPEKLNTLFTQVIDDLSYSRTFYPNRSVRVYLNKISREYFSIIYNNKKEKGNRIKQFWLDELPQIVLHCRKQILFSLIIFLVSACIGIFSAVKDPEFTSSILGEHYVAMTKENIEKGDPMAVYKKGHQVDMFLGITFNNLMVAFRTYATGVFFSIGTIAILLYNGIMVGCFQFFFIERGLFAESALTIWQHGTLEISSIVLAGGAGLTLGSGLLFPGTYSRLQAFQISAIRSLKLMLGITPIFVFAAIIESFLTRYTDVPDGIRLFLIFLSLSFIAGYFVVYPWLKLRNGFDAPLKEVRLTPALNETPNLERIKNNAELLKDGFLFYKKNIGKLLPWIIGVTLLATTGDYFLKGDRETIILFDEWWLTLVKNLLYALRTPFFMYVLLNTAATSLIVYQVCRVFTADHGENKKPVFQTVSFLQICLVFSLLYGLIFWIDSWGMMLLACLFAGFFIWSFIITLHNKNFFTAFPETWNLVIERFGQILGLQFILLLLSFSFLLMLSAPLLYMYLEVLQWQFGESDDWSGTLIAFVETFIKIFAFNLILPLLVATSGYLYFSLREIHGAENLKRSIALIGSKAGKPRRS